VRPIDRSTKPAQAPAKSSPDKPGSKSTGSSEDASGRDGAVRTLVLVPVLTRTRNPAGARTGALHSPEDRLAEAKGLAEAIDLDVVDALLVPVSQPNPATLLGSGKVDEMRARIVDADVALVVVDHAITPGQQRNLEVAWNAKVLDRTGLILEIFGRRAQTREGRLQVELAHLSYQKGRLVRAWTHLERQRGGRGFLGGPGEAQIELDRRMLDERIIAIKRELEGVVRTRDLHRKGRRKVPYPIVAIVGYTNAGKSTLFNRVAGVGVLAMDQVFATLDPTMREVRLPTGRRIILSDTVGFISDLPTQLVAAFRATLEEVIEADLILHVRDIAHAETEAQAADVAGVLDDLGIETATGDGHILEVWNKIDLLSPVTREEAEAAARFRTPHPVLMSAATGEGVARLLDTIDERLGSGDEILTLTLPAHEGRLLAWMHENADVLAQEADGEGAIALRVRIASEKKMRLARLLRDAGLALS
jgi:GTP-binding protein HflX